MSVDGKCECVEKLWSVVSVSVSVLSVSVLSVSVLSVSVQCECEQCRIWGMPVICETISE